jgi:hypothetical protein
MNMQVPGDNLPYTRLDAYPLAFWGFFDYQYFLIQRYFLNAGQVKQISQQPVIGNRDFEAIAVLVVRLG